MNTRGLTELIIVSVGLQLGVLDRDLFSLMVVVALVTTAMTDLSLPLVHPRWRIQRDRVARHESRQSTVAAESPPIPGSVAAESPPN